MNLLNHTVQCTLVHMDCKKSGNCSYYSDKPAVSAVLLLAIAAVNFTDAGDNVSNRYIANALYRLYSQRTLYRPHALLHNAVIETIISALLSFSRH
jgi:hypothetical protein